ncbi:MAG: hypothetical protein IPI46_09825 [Bacteroidetes bacterium]|nr:hypothetical protein [Bacteroidota bacterium]
MLSEYAKKIIQDIISGAVVEEPKNSLTTTRSLLCSSFATNTKITRDFEGQQRIKKEQEQLILRFIEDNSYLEINAIDEKYYLTEGGEAKVFFSLDNRHVLKLNDAVYYNNWLDFLNSLIIHNQIFPDTSYELKGFMVANGVLLAVLEQNFIVSNEDVDLAEVETLLSYNGFEKIKRNDFYNKELGLLLEDIHDENVIKQNGSYFFIDTVFYLNVFKNDV